MFPSVPQPSGIAGNLAFGVQSIAYAGTIVPDAALGASVIVGALTGNITVNAPTNPSAGRLLTLEFTQDATGGRTVTWGAGLNTTWQPRPGAGLTSALTLHYDGTSWQPLLGAGRRTATLVVAASNAPAASRAAADYVCTGTNDHLVINAALAALPQPSLTHGIGGTVELTEGNFTCGGTITIAGSGVTLRGRGYEATYVRWPTALGRGTAGITVGNGTFFYANRLTELHVRGPGSCTAANRAANMDGVSLNGAVRVDRVMVQNMDRAFVFRSSGGHENIDQVSASGCYYPLYYWSQGGDQHVSNSVLSGNGFASVACSSLTLGIAGLIDRTHLGYCPLCFYQEPLSAPSGALTLAAASGTLPAGDYTVACTYLLPTQNGGYAETTKGTSSATITLGANAAISVSGFTLPTFVDQAKFYITSNTAGVANGYVATYAGTGTITLNAAGDGATPPSANPAPSPLFLYALNCQSVSMESFQNGVAATDVPAAATQNCYFLNCTTANPYQTPYGGFRHDYAIEGTAGSFGMNYWRGGFWVGDGALGSFGGGSWWDVDAADLSGNSCAMLTASPNTGAPTLLLANKGAILSAEHRTGTLSFAAPANGALPGTAGLLVATFSSRAHHGPLSGLAPRATALATAGQSTPGALPSGYAYAISAGALLSTPTYATAAAAGVLVAAAPLTGWRQARPAAPASLVATTGGSLVASTTYSWAYAVQGTAFGTNSGLSRAGMNAALALSGGQNAAQVTFPNFSWPSWYTAPTSIVLYRNKATDQTRLFQVATLSFATYNNGAATYTDTIADGSLGAGELSADQSAGTAVTFTYQPQAVATCPTMGATGQSGATVPLLSYPLPSGTKIALGYGTANAEVVTTNAAFYPGASVALTWGTTTVATHAQGDPIVIMPSATLSFSYSLAPVNGVSRGQ